MPWWGVVAQRLVRKICEYCRVPDSPPEEMRRGLKISDPDFKAFKGTGCDRCHDTGYKGRIGVYEIFQVDSEIKRMIHRDATEPELLHATRLTGMTTLLDDAIAKIRKGVTTCEEALRVLGPQDVTQIACVHCNALMEERHYYCPYCGKELIKLCGQCGQLLVKDWRHCPQCGTAVCPSEENG
jgi:RNA polymerase subunit RPABC4/transcription elongation factor Spt4